MKNYRTIWSRHNGEIPIDEYGRCYEIHHIDGDRNNNCIDNLMCVSVEDHYKIHLSQNDWGAVRAILSRIELTPEQEELKRRAASLQNAKRFAEGIHPFQKLDRSALSKQTMERRLKNEGVAFLGIEDTVENARRGGLAAAAKHAGFLDTNSDHHGSKYVKGSTWWNNGVINKRSVSCPGEDFVKGILHKSSPEKHSTVTCDE